MSIVYAGALTAGLDRTALLASGASATLMAWLYPTANPAASAYFNALAEYGALGVSIFNTAGTTRWNLGTATTDNTGSVVSLNTWAHLTMTTSSATAHTLYLNGVSDATSVGSGSATRVIVGNYDLASAAWTGRIAAVKIWDGALTAAEIAQEMRQLLPARLANFKAFYPLFSASDLVDYSGQAQSLTTNGTAPTSADGPPVPWKSGRRRFFVPLGAAATLDQYAFRARNDDGTEATATWASAENAGATLPLNSTQRIRIGVDATGDPASKAYQLEYRVNGGAWKRARPMP